jgi:glycosyltransferase involved in cell wall biosynthesis
VIALDLSRLLSRAASATPTGIDRVELAYARYVAASGQPHCYAARSPLGGIGLLPAAAAEEFSATLGHLWRDGGAPRDRRRVVRLARRLRPAAMFGASELRQAMGRSSAPRVYLLVSHENLDRAPAIARLKAATGARFMCLIHDLIPLELPDLTRPSQPNRHRRRMATTAALADAVIVNSLATHRCLTAYLGPSAAHMPIVVAPLASELPDGAAPAANERPYFVCIATIEARKNHRLLFDLWRRLALELGGQAPRLLLIGRRGYASKRIVTTLSTLNSLVSEHSDVPDAGVATVLRGARALLLPSLAEGFGLPVIEALAQRVPVLCSDIPALRESGAGIPDYLDPADDASWYQAILDYTVDSPRRQAQLARIAGWRPPSWQEHFAAVDRLIGELR